MRSCCFALFVMTCDRAAACMQDDKTSAAGKQYTVYHIVIRGKSGTKTVLKRFHDFRQFDEVTRRAFC